METLYCGHCDKQVGFYTELKSNQNTAWCNECSGFLKNVPYSKPALYVGKYSGKPIEEIADLNYLQWAIKTMKLNERTKTAITNRIAQLEHEAK
jgi:hypothetical protein